MSRPRRAPSRRLRRWRPPNGGDEAVHVAAPGAGRGAWPRRAARQAPRGSRAGRDARTAPGRRDGRIGMHVPEGSRRRPVCPEVVVEGVDLLHRTMKCRISIAAEQRRLRRRRPGRAAPGDGDGRSIAPRTLTAAPRRPRSPVATVCPSASGPERLGMDGAGVVALGASDQAVREAGRPRGRNVSQPRTGCRRCERLVRFDDRLVGRVAVERVRRPTARTPRAARRTGRGWPSTADRHYVAPRGTWPSIPSPASRPAGRRRRPRAWSGPPWPRAARS